MSFGDKISSGGKSKATIHIDGSNIFATMKALNDLMGMDYRLDWQRIKTFFAKKHDLVRLYYYTALPDHEPNQTISFKPMIDFIEYQVGCVQTKPMQHFVDPFTGKERSKGNIDLELAFDAWDAGKYVQDIYLFTGDGDFCVLVRRLQQIGVRVHVVSSYKTRPAFASDSLRRQADSFIELSDPEVVEQWCKTG